MNRSIVLVFMAGCTGAVMSRVVDQGRTLSAAPATEEPAAKTDHQGGTRVGLVDIAAIFKQSARVKSQSDVLLADIKVAEEAAARQREDLRKLAAPADKLEKNSAEYKRIEAEVKKGLEELNQQVAIQKKAFVDRQAQCYIEAYDEIAAATGDYAKKMGFQLVLRINRQPIDRPNNDQIFQELNKTIVYQDGIDITDDVLKFLNGQPLEKEPE
ncbi:MAG TPA: OmpH family outer membrane protein [Pirellulales bacterium]|jgi:Skp family chaperone for outer membrane proteins|nr:OmpH family outer membrane protein [Pirellulales bacterium]